MPFLPRVHSAVRRLALSMLTCALAMSPLRGEEFDYLSDVKPVLRERCFACHGALKQESGLRVDTATAILRGGDSGAAVVADDLESSLLWERVSTADDEYRMPPEGAALTADELDAIRRWILSGAAEPESETAEADPNAHWAFVPPQRPALATTNDAPSHRNPIDQLLQRQRREQELVALDTVDRRRLMRRVYLDLIGLPPTEEEYERFLSDLSPDAYETIVDELLESPHYGERWGRHWMDVWRYTDWYGLGAQLRNSQKHIWHWRDWIVESLNADVGYDQMVREMLAGDELAPTEPSTLRATGFLARNYYLFNRTTWLDDTIEHTAKAFLGLTVNCAKCHDHKYDPITHEDYYRFRAIFEPHQIRLDSVAGTTDLENDGIPRAFDAHPDALTYVHIRGNPKDPDTSTEIAPGVPAFFGASTFTATPIALPLVAHRPDLRDFVLRDQLAVAQAAIDTARTEVESAVRDVAIASENAAVTRALLGQLDRQGAATPASLGDWEVGPGQWETAGGEVRQSESGGSRRYLRSLGDHPANFIASVRFRTLGGEKWKSFGVAFDVADGREKLVYLSAVEPGSKLQISYDEGTGSVYPAEGRQARAVELDRTYSLVVAVQDQAVWVLMDGRPALAYRLPVERRPGRIDLVAFDAAVAIESFDVFPLNDTPPRFAIADGSVNVGADVSVAEVALEVKRAALAVADLKPAAVESAFAADLASCQSETDALSAKILRLEAGGAARRLAAANSTLALAEARHALAVAEANGTADAERKKLEEQVAKAAKTNREAIAACDESSEAYTSLRASRKALEGPDEKDDSRYAPYPASSTGRRTALAGWITDRENPLTARVAVNHIWLRHFGQPLVESVNDFGRRAAPPIQQELLDWLAVELVESGWSMKQLHRLMVTSEAYRLESSLAQADASTAERDPDNHYYWRRLPMRMEAESIRDGLLQLAGELDSTTGGPTVDPGADTQRRSLYFTRSRDHSHPFLSMFDEADILRCYRRSESIVPQQALAMSNSRLALEMADRIATKVDASHPNSNDADFVRAAFELVLGKAPNEDEMAACVDFLSCGGDDAGDGDTIPKARADLVHVLINHNDFLTVR